MADRGAPAAEDARYCMTQLREHAPDLYLASLLLPDRIRADVVALHAFHSEITAITLAAPDPLAGEVRLQWWMDVLHGERGGEAAQNPLARALLAVMTAHDLPADVLVRKLEAHIFDLYSDPMGDTATLEGYLGETRSVLFQLASMIADPNAAPDVSDASGHAGVATGYVWIIENMARHRAQHRVFVPSDLLADAGISAQVFLASDDSIPASVLAGLALRCEDNLARTRAHLVSKPPELVRVFAPLALVPLYLKRIRKHPQKALTGLPPVSQLRRQWALWRW